MRTVQSPGFESDYLVLIFIIRIRSFVRSENSEYNPKQIILLNKLHQIPEILSGSRIRNNKQSVAHNIVVMEIFNGVDIVISRRLLVVIIQLLVRDGFQPD